MDDDIEWLVEYEESEYSPRYKTYHTRYKGIDAVVYPVKKRYGSRCKGYEYELIGDGVEFDSYFETSLGCDYAKTLKQAMEWVKNTIDEFRS